MDDLSDDDFVASSRSVNTATSQTERAARHKLRCLTCGFKAYSKYYLRLHVQTRHHKGHKCQLCSFSSSMISGLKKHMNVDHKSSNLACDKCSHVAVSSERLRTHQRRTHGSGPKNFLCRLKRSENSADRPENSADRPENSADRPENSADRPENSADRPENSADRPENSADRPENSADRPENSADRPENSADRPENSADRPENSADRPENSADRPENSADRPENSADRPENSADRPENSADRPENGADRPENSAERVCQARFSCRDGLRRHLAEQHNLASAVDKIESEFDSKAEFESWKADYERRHGVFYSRATAQPGQSVQYECSRSGVHTPSGSGRRRLKSQGSAKQGFKCTSALHVRERDGGALSAVLYTHHYGHSDGAANLPHIRLPTRDRALAKAQLVAGISTARVIRNLREHCGGDSDAGPSRTYWVQPKDINNMCKSVGIRPGGDSTKHANEVISVRMYAEQLRSSDQHHLLSLKIPGEEGTSGTERLDPVDFLLGFCTHHQLRKLVQHGSTVVCMDGTHGTSGHDYHLITLLVLNEHGAGLPVAWLISSREDETAISCLLDGLIQACSNANMPFPMAKYFMSDKALAYFNAWVHSTGQDATQHLLCAWHVVKAWKAKLPLISDMDARQEAYDALWGIMHEADEAKAVAAAEALAGSLLAHSNTRDFGHYFLSTWLDSTRKWTLGRRDAAGISTNMHVEAFHRVLKYQYLEGRVSKRVDKCIGALLSFADDQMLKMARRQLWQARSLHGEEIAKRHFTAAELVRAGQATATPVADSLLPAWDVGSSAEDASQLHRVEQEHRQCPDLGCQQRYQECRACIHHFRCSCPDWTSHKLICKHVHVVCLLVEGLTSQLRGPNPPAPDMVCSDMSDALPQPSRSGDTTSKQRFLAELEKVAALAVSVSGDAEDLFAAGMTKLSELHQLLTAAPRVTDVTRGQLPSAAEGAPNQPWNARIQPQPSFQSRRAKRPRAQAPPVRTDSAAARKLVNSLSLGDSGRERLPQPQEHRDHTY